MIAEGAELNDVLAFSIMIKSFSSSDQRLCDWQDRIKASKLVHKAAMSSESTNTSRVVGEGCQLAFDPRLAGLPRSPVVHGARALHQTTAPSHYLGHIMRPIRARPSAWLARSADSS